MTTNLLWITGDNEITHCTPNFDHPQNTSQCLTISTTTWNEHFSLNELTKRGRKKTLIIYFIIRSNICEISFPLIIMFSQIGFKITIKNLCVPLKIIFYTSYGSCYHTLGKSKVFVRELYRLQVLSDSRCYYQFCLGRAVVLTVWKGSKGWDQEPFPDVS